jgi:hypothetical protein
MVVQLVQALRLPISPIRLEAYRPANGNDLDMIVNYVWNIELSEALYPCLQTFEIALRNSVHRVLTNHYQSEYWFDRGDLLEWQQERVQDARDELTKSQKPLEAGRIVAELTFGFWSSMFNSPYEEILWHANGAVLIDRVFPNLPRALRNRKKLSQRVERIRRLRNRVFHYEPIWKTHDLAQRHRQIHEALDWISPEMRAVMMLCDRFDSVFLSQPLIQATLQAHLGSLNTGPDRK